MNRVILGAWIGISLIDAALLKSNNATAAVIAYSGFNASAGYVGGSGIAGLANSDPGWTYTWWVSDDGSGQLSQTLGVAQQPATPSPDGGLALHMTVGSAGETWAYRTFAEQTTGLLLIDQFVQVPAGGFLISRSGDGGNVQNIATLWDIHDGTFNVLNGDGNGGGQMLNTGFAVTANQWYETSTLIDLDTKTFEFFVNGQQQLTSQTLHFRSGTGPGFYIDRMDYLADSPAWIDGVTISSVIVPEPASVILLGIGVAAYGSRWRKLPATA